MRMPWSRAEESEVDARVREALAVAGIEPADAAYHHLPQGGGALSGNLPVADASAFETALSAVTLALVAELGAAADRVTVYLTGLLADGSVLTPGDLGTPQPPTGLDLRRRFR